MGPGWLIDVLLLVGGLAVLAAAGEALVRGAARLAQILGISTLVVGLTVVAFGTSAPEAAVSVFAAERGATDLAVANVVGSNVANILLILGLAALVRPLVVSRSLIRIDGPIMIVVLGVFMAVVMGWGEIGRWTGGVFLCGLIVYTALTYILARRTGPPEAEPPRPLTGLARRCWYNALLVVIGVAGLVYGARLIVSGASGVAQRLGVSEHIIGLTIVAVGTSLPELAATLVAARHRQADLAVGNVVGSNIFNALLVTGLAALVRPLPVNEYVIRIDGPAMVAASVVFYVIVYFGKKLTRAQGAVFLGLYVFYLVWTGQRAA